jgi:N-acetylglucosaminyl-diphospho-decaprenol L-rhamnosyltransferase
MTDSSSASSTNTTIESQARVLVVIVNYKTGRLVVECLASLEAEIARFPNARVVVVDNPSGDDSVEVIRSAVAERGWASWVAVLRSPLNGGFSYGNNQAIRPALASSEPPEYVWLLNPDTQVRPGALAELVRFMDDRPEVGITGSSIEEADGTVWPYAFRFPSFLSELDAGLKLGVVSKWLKDHVVTREMSNVPERVDWLPGASMMVRRRVFDAIGLMDEGYFLYFEETDFCLQAARAGFESWYVPASRVMHIAGQSTGVTGKQNIARRLPAYWFESRARYFMKNHGRLYGATTDLAWAASYATWRVRRRLQGKKVDEDPPHMLWDFLRHSTLVQPRMPSGRVPSAK